MTAQHLQQAIFTKFGAASELLVPNYTPDGWYECDVLRVTKAGFAEEFECKISLADFKADALKGPGERNKLLAHYDRRPLDERTKHQRLADRDGLPCRFWFVVPDTLAPSVASLLPWWAGLARVRWWNNFALLHVASPAPRLHSRKVDTKVIAHARSVFYYRFWNLRSATLRRQPELPI